MGLDNLQSDITGFITANPLATAAGAAIGGAVVGGVATGLIVSAVKKKRTSKSKRSRKKGRRIKHTRRGWAQDRKRRSKQKWEVAYQRRKKKRKSKSSKRRGKVYYARKTGQPYIILASGKAKFIKGKRRK